MKTELSHTLIQYPANAELVLFLIREELKCRKLFLILQKVGLDDCFYQANLDPLILSGIELNADSDEAFIEYCNIIDRHSKKIQANDTSVKKQALKAYEELLAAKKKIIITLLIVLFNSVKKFLQ